MCALAWPGSVSFIFKRRICVQQWRGEPFTLDHLKQIFLSSADWKAGCFLLLRRLWYGCWWIHVNCFTFQTCARSNYWSNCYPNAVTLMRKSAYTKLSCNLVMKGFSVISSLNDSVIVRGIIHHQKEEEEEGCAHMFTRSSCYACSSTLETEQNVLNWK